MNFGDGSNRNFTGKETNAAVVFDAISEGEIVGLVNGDASIYFDDVPLRDGVSQIERGSFATISTTVAASAVVTLSDGALDNVDVTGSPKRLIHIYGAGKQGATSDPDITFTCIAGDHTIVASAAFFTADMVKKTRQTNGAGMLRIVGAGFEELGSDLLTMITEFTDSTHVEVDVAPVTSVTAAAGGLDHISTIISYDPSNNQVTMSDNAVTAITGSATTGAGYTIIGPANPNAINTSKSGLKRNFDNVQYEFRSGHKHQTITSLIGNSPPSASFVLSPGQRMAQTQISGVTGTGTTSAYTYTAATIGATEPAETDAVGWTIEAPQGLMATSTKSGNEHNSWVEITVDFEYTRDGSSYHSSRLVGRSDSALGSASIHDFSDNTRGMGTGFIIHRTTKPIIEQYEFSVQNFKPFTNWRLKFQRVNEPMKSLGHHQHSNESIIKHIESHITDKLTYPYTAYAAVSFSSKDFSTTPKRGYHIRGKKVQVPTNYKTREEMSSNSASYARNVSTGGQESTYQDWDGNFRGDVSSFAATSVNHALVYTDNPAWIFYDLVRDPRYGLGHIVDASLVDKYSLYQIARYCDELVPDGKGGQEPRFTCNVYITKAQEAYKVLKDLASVFRGITLWMDGQLVAIQDRPREPIYTFSQGNVIDGEFSYESTSERIRANQYLVKWMDPEDNFKEKVEIVDDVDNIIEKGRIVSKDFKAFGCTSQGQANRIGKWAITTDKLETELCKFSTGMNAAILRPGDVVNIQDATIDTIQFSGRIKAGTSTTIVTLDRAITLASSTTYKLHLIYPEGGAYLVSPEKVHINSTTYTKGDLILLDESGATINTFAKATNVKEDSDAASNGGTENNGKVELAWSENSRVETKTISTSAGTIAAGSNITVSSAFSSAPNSEVVWAISGRTTTSTNEVTGNPKQYRIMGVESQGEGVFNIGAAEYRDEKYDIVEKGYTLEPTRESVLKKPVNMHRDASYPSPASLTFNLQSVAASFSTTDSTEDVTGALEALISWATPVETWVADNVLNATFVNEALDNSETTITVGDAGDFAATGYGVIEAGTSQEEVVYWSAKSSNDLTVTRGALRSPKRAHDTGVSFEERRNYERVPPGITQFEIEHNFGIVSKNDGFNREFVGAKTYAFRVPNVPAGTYTVRIRAIYEGGALSEWAVLEKTITAPVTGQSQSLEKLTFGGILSAGLTIDSSGNWDLSASPYTVVNTAGREYSVTQATQSHAQRRQSFSSLTDGQTGYALFDASAVASDPWKAIIQVTDTTYHKGQTGLAGSFTWWQEVGASANGLTQASGTITTTLDSDTVTGSSTAFTTDFAAGDFIRLHDSASTSFGTGSWYGYVDQVVSNTELKVVGAVTKAFTTKYAYKGTFRPDFINDFIISKIIRNSSSSYVLNNYAGGGGVDGAAGNDGSAGTDARVVNLTMADQTFEYNTSGLIPSPSDAVVTATALNTTGTVYYQFYKNDSSVQNTTTATYTYTPPSAYSDMPEKLEVQIREGSNSGDILARDQITASGLQEGLDGFSTILTNEAHTLPTATDDTVTYTGSGTDIDVWHGTTHLAYGTGNSQFVVAVADDTNITVGSASTVSTYSRRFADHSSMTADTASITYTITAKDPVGVSSAFTRIQTFSKSKQGIAAVSAILSNDNHSLPADEDGVVSSYADSGTTIKVYEGETALTFQTGTVLAGQFAVAIGNTANITEGSASGDESTTCTIGNHSGAADGTDSFVITYTISGKNAAGDDFTTFTKDQTLTKAKSGNEGKGTTTIYYLQTGFSIPSTPTAGTDETPGSWILTVPTAASGKSIWYSIGTKPVDSSTWTFTAAQFYLGDLTYTIPGILNINPGGSGLGIINLTTNDYLNTVIEPTHTSGSGHPSGTQPKGSTYIETGTDPDTLWTTTGGGTWVEFGLNKDTTYSAGTNMTLSGSTFSSTDTNTTYSAGDFAITSLSGYDAALYANANLSNADVLDSIGFTPYNSSNPSGYNNYTLPTNVVIGTPSISGTTITIPRNGAGNVTLTTQDTNTTYSAGDFNITALAGFSADDYANANLEWGSITVTSGAAAASFSSYNGSTWNGVSTTGTISIVHPADGTFEATYTWVNDGSNVRANTGSGTEGFALTNTGSGNDAWTFSAATHSAAQYISKTVTHTASSNTITLICSMVDLTGSGGGGGKCLTPAMLPEGLKIGDEVDSPEGKTKVVYIIHKQREGYYILEDELEITNDHPILIEGEWILAEEYQGKKEYIDEPTDVIYVETENELLTVKDWTVGGKY